MKEIVLYIPKGAPNRISLLAASEALVRQISIPSADGFDPRVGIACIKVDSERLFESAIKQGSISVALVVAPGDLGYLARAIGRIHGSRDAKRPTPRFIVLAAGNFPAGKRPPHTRIFALDKTEDARAAVKLALEAADEEERKRLALEAAGKEREMLEGARDELRDQVARI